MYDFLYSGEWWMESITIAFISVAGTVMAAAIGYLAVVRKTTNIVERLPEEHKELSGEHKELSGEHKELSGEHRELSHGQEKLSDSIFQGHKEISELLVSKFEKLSETGAGITLSLEKQEARRQEAERQEQLRYSQLPLESRLMDLVRDVYGNNASLAGENMSLKGENTRLREETAALEAEITSLREELTSLKVENDRLHGKSPGNVRQSQKACRQEREKGAWEPER